jgi:asparaginyl-tRNA synthetase
MKRASVFSALTASEQMPLVKFGEEIELFGWVRTIRGSKNVSFIVLYDGSSFETLQVVVDASIGIDLSGVTSGASIRVVGKTIESKGSEQSVDFEASVVELIGAAGEDYPIQPKRHSMEFFRENLHLRTRTKLFQAIFRIRHQLKMATYEFFDQGGFIQVDTPIISASDCEGAGEMFRVDEAIEFFGKDAGLTVSGQLEAETAALGLGRVYTFGPTFRAEKSQTSRHLAEFWMIEPEISFADLEFTSMLAEGYLRCVIGSVLQKCSAEVDYLEEYIQEEEKNMKQELRSTPLRDKLEDIVITKFEKITYTEAFDILKRSKPAKKGKFEFPIEEWGMDFQSEHERYLVEKHFNAPVIVTDYPKEIKAFYMRDNEDGKTVAAMDILFPGIGEIVGGSQREERLDVLKEKMTTFGISHDEMSWYLDTRRFGTAPHSGFGVGFERLVQFTTGMKNIRDVILYPRTPGKI